MFLKLFLAFTLIPMIELYLLIKLGAVIGAFNTLLLVILTGAAGAYLARRGYAGRTDYLDCRHRFADTGIVDGYSRPFTSFAFNTLPV